jgi:hypothetical protein
VPSPEPAVFFKSPPSALRPAPRLLQGVRHRLEQSKDHLLGLGGLAEEQEGGERLVADVPRLEDGRSNGSRPAGGPLSPELV